MAASRASEILRRNPDVLDSIANLSSDEVFTPPWLAKQMLDSLEKAWADSNDGASIWEDPTVTFMDPCAKSGVFLREIVARLSSGLAKNFPNLQDRVDHILTKQVFGIATTQLTSLMSRRSVYCSKAANGKHSITKKFSDGSGNIWFVPTNHEWIGGKKTFQVDPLSGDEIEILTARKCKFCGAPETTYSRDDALEEHAYEFIHWENATSVPASIFGEEMQFDVIIGNPPYQLGSDGGTRDVPIYQHFVEQAKKLQPRFISMVIPSRWMVTGLGLKAFRETMLKDRRISVLVDFPTGKEVFPGVDVKGGVCYFLWQSDHVDDCQVTLNREGVVYGPISRRLDEFDVFVRDHRAVSILNKVLLRQEGSITEILSVDKEFGWTSNFDGFSSVERPGDIPLHYVRKGVRGVGYIARKDITKSVGLIDKWKLLIPKAGSDGGQKIPDLVLGRPQIAGSPSVCTQSFLFFSVNSEKEAANLESYLRTRFFRFIVSLRKITQDATRNTYLWVPMQDFSTPWTDEMLFRKYGISPEEITFIESMIRSMELTDGED